MKSVYYKSDQIDISNDLVLVTNNFKHYQSITGLSFDNWKL